MRRFLALIAIPVAGIAAAALIPAGSGALNSGTTYNGQVNGTSDGATVYVKSIGGGRCTVSTTTPSTWAITDQNVDPDFHGKIGGRSSTTEKVIASVNEDTSGASATFTAFGVAQTMPAMNVPCSGFGTATFRPGPSAKGAASDIVGIEFAQVAS